MSMISRSMLACGLFALLPLSCNSATITIAYNGAPAPAQTAIQYAADIWGDILVSPVPINVLVTWAPLGTSTLGITFPNGRRDFPSAPLPQTWYATSLANSIAGAELNAGENDIEIFLSSSVNWYYGTDGAPANNEYDLVSIVLHELCHGFGFVGLDKKVDDVGSLGTLALSDFSPLFTTFPWPELDTLPSIFDRFLSSGTNGALAFMDNPGTDLGAAMSGNDLYFNGPLSMAGNGGIAPRIYAPAAFALGSSCVHLNESTYPNNDPNELMTPFSSAGNANHWPGPICLNMLRDIGWTIAADVGMEERIPPTAVMLCFPNPATDLLHLSFLRPNAIVRILDPSGRAVRTSSDDRPIDVRDLASGLYTVMISEDQRHSSIHFMKN